MCQELATSPSSRSSATYTQPSLDDLLVAAGEGSDAAFAKVYDQLAPAVFGVSWRVVRNRALAEETTQDVFLSVWRSSPRFDPGRGSARAWVMTLAHRRAVDVVRSHEASSRREIKAAHREPPFDVVSEQATTRLEGETVRRLLWTLTDLQREALTLAYFGGYTSQEMSELLDTSRSTVKTRLRDGLIRLRRSMARLEA